jgi:hypothetical protein
MTPYERENARKKYQAIKQLPPEKKEALKQKWHEYESLPEEQRDQLRQSHLNAHPLQKPPQ